MHLGCRRVQLGCNLGANPRSGLEMLRTASLEMLRNPSGPFFGLSCTNVVQMDVGVCTVGVDPRSCLEMLRTAALEMPRILHGPSLGSKQ